jgi:MFS family permease
VEIEGESMASTFMDHPWRPTAAAFFVNGAVFGVWATQIPLAKERLALDPAVLGVLLLILGGGGVSAMAASGYLIRRFGTATIMRWSGAFFCALLPLTATASSVPLLAIILFLFGASGGSMDVSMNAHAAGVERQAGKAYMSSFHGMWSIGGLIGAALGSLSLGFLSGAAQAFCAAVVLGAILAVAQTRFGQRAAPTEAHAGRSLKPEGTAIIIGLLAGLCFASEGSILDWSSIYMKTELGAATEMAGAGYAAFSATMAIGRFFGDWIRSHIGATVIVRLGAGLALLGVVTGPLSGEPVLAVIGFGLTGLGLSNVVPVLISAAGASRDPEIAIATVTTLGYAGLLAAPPLLGFVAHATSLGTTFGIVAVMCLAIGLNAMIARRANLPRPA